LNFGRKTADIITNQDKSYGQPTTLNTLTT